MRLAVVLAGLLLATGWAMAQRTSLSPSAAVACLSPPAAARGAPEYPFEAFKARLPLDVQVRQRFTDPGQAPQVTVRDQQGDSSFVDAVRSHMATLRLPCHDGTEPVDLDVSFAFRPDEAPLSPVPVDPADAERQRHLPLVRNIRQQRLQFDMPPKSLPAVYGDNLTLTVPCLKIDLNPTGVTS